ncbi:MAG: DUF167 domain-containing protein [Pseudomonadaceae bacterium]|nr:DUF167 domain-containing protein [Pseudomonadaceae bacterium]
MTDKKDVLLRVRVTPKASAVRVVETTGEDGQLIYKVYVTAPPEDGKANEAVVKALAKHLGVAKGRLVLVRGESCRDKVVRLEG